MSTALELAEETVQMTKSAVQTLGQTIDRIDDLPLTDEAKDVLLAHYSGKMEAYRIMSIEMGKAVARELQNPIAVDDVKFIDEDPLPRP